MSNINTGSMSGFNGLVPSHLQTGAGANSATRAVVQEGGDHGASTPPMFDFKPTFAAAASTFSSGIDAVHTLKDEVGKWIGDGFGFSDQNHAPGGT